MLVSVGSGAAAQDKYALLKVMVANPTMIAAYKAGIPGNGEPCHRRVAAKDYIFTAYGKR